MHDDQQRTGDLARLRENGAMTLAELREFTSRLKGRRPVEMLGVVASSGLFHSLLLATIGCALVIGVGTVVPYTLAKRSGDEPEVPATRSPTEPAEPATAAPVAAAPSAAPDNGIPNGADPATAAARMGIDETKNAPADSNPLDSEGDIDKLLDGLD